MSAMLNGISWIADLSLVALSSIFFSKCCLCDQVKDEYLSKDCQHM
jgi:hypothetical protein